MDYSYASGAVKAAEVNLFDKTKLAKLFRCNDGEFCQALLDMGYGAGTTLEGIINAELVKTKKFLQGVTPNDDVMNLFYLRNDAQNIKVIYKSKVFDLPHHDNFVDAGVISKDVLLEYILHDNTNKVPDAYVPLLKDIGAKVANIKNARVLSAKIDSCVFAYIFEQLNVHKDEALKVYFQNFINFANIMTLVRCQALKWGLDKFLEMYIENGTIDKDSFVSAYSLASEGLYKHFMKKDYGEKISKGLKVYTEDMDLNHLEKFLDELMLVIMKDYSIKFSTVGPLVYYYLEKQAEAKNIRMIYSNRETDVADLLNY